MDISYLIKFYFKYFFYIVKYLTNYLFKIKEWLRED